MKKIFKGNRFVALFLVLIMVFTGCGNNDASSDSGYTTTPSTTNSATPPIAQEPSYDASADIGADTSASYPETIYYEYDYSGTSIDNIEEDEAEPIGVEEYRSFSENAERDVSVNPLLTFSLKIDTASYRNVVRYINSGNIPPSDAVRIEEMINYFNYDTALQESSNSPFSIYTEVGPSPFNMGKEIAFVRVKSKDIDRSNLPNSNLTFLIDTSGSMNSYDKMPLLKSAFGLLVENLKEDDTVSIVTYAGSAGVLLDSVSGDRKEIIMGAIEDLMARGSTAGADGINTAYALAEKNYNPEANNRVILATDGDFNVGLSSVKELEELISEKRGNGIYMSILGFGTENLKDNRMETLAKNGNGNYSYIDSVASAEKVLVDELSANLFTIADDVKAQIEFNPARVSAYRLIGYENRMLADRDFNDDTKDAGEIGIGTDVVLMFEITRTESIELKYQTQEDGSEEDSSGNYLNELFEVKIRYKDPGQNVSKLITHAVKADRYSDFNSSDFDFALSVAMFGHLLKNSPFLGDVTAQHVLGKAKDSLGEDRGNYRREFIQIVEDYISLGGR